MPHAMAGRTQTSYTLYTPTYWPKRARAYSFGATEFVFIVSELYYMLYYIM